MRQVQIRQAQGDSGTISVSVPRILRMVRLGRVHPLVRSVAEGIVASVSRGSGQQAAAIHEWVQRNVQYTAHPVNTQLLPHPAVLIQQIQQRGFASADCVGQTTLEMSLLESVGIPTRAAVIRADGGNELSHIYLQAGLNDRWVPADPIYPQNRLGFAPPGTGLLTFSPDDGSNIPMMMVRLGANVGITYAIARTLGLAVGFWSLLAFVISIRLANKVVPV